MNATIQAPTNNILESIEFYSKLGFNQVYDDTIKVFTDGKVIIEVNPDRYSRAGIKLYKTSWENEVKELQELSAAVKIRDGYLISDPNGIRVYLVEGDAPYNIKKSDSSFSVLGNYAGLTIESTDFPRSIKFWDILGFALTSGDKESQWAVMGSNDLSVTFLPALACPHLFFNPSLTYFNGKINNPKIIDKIRELGIPFTEEITVFNKEGKVDNVIIRDPGGLGFFIFND